MEEYEIDLREIFLTLWRYKYLIIGIFLLAVIISALYSTYVLDPVFKAEAVLSISPYSSTVGGVRVVNLSLEGYRIFYTSPRVLQEMKLFIQEEKEEDEEISINSIRRRTDVSLDAQENLLTVSYSSSDPQEAYRFLGEWIQIFREQSVDYILTENLQILDRLERVYRESEEAFLNSRAEYTAFEQEHSISLKKKRLEDLEIRYQSAASRLSDVERRIASNEAMLVYLEDRLAEEESHIDEVLQQLKKEMTEGEYASLRLLVGNLKEVNPIYVNLRGRINDIGSSLESAYEEQKILERSLQEFDERIDVLNREIATIEEEEEHLARELDDNRERYYKSETRYLDVADHVDNIDSSGIRVLISPTVPESRIAPNRTLNVALSGVLALFVGVFLVFFINFMKPRED